MPVVKVGETGKVLRDSIPRHDGWSMVGSPAARRGARATASGEKVCHPPNDPTDGPRVGRSIHHNINWHRFSAFLPDTFERRVSVLARMSQSHSGAMEQ